MIVTAALYSLACAALGAAAVLWWVCRDLAEVVR